MVVSRFSVLRGHEAINIKFIHLFCHLFLYQIRPKFCSTFNQSLLKMLPVNYKIHNLESESESCSVVSNSLQPRGLYSPWNSPGQNTGVGSLSHLWGIFPTQGLNPGLLHCKWILYQLRRKGSLRILEWVAYLFSSGSNPLG